jgi:hypothetical protein
MQNRNLAIFCAARNARRFRRALGHSRRKHDLRRLARFLFESQLETMAKATPADVKAAANKWLRANHYTMLVKPFPKLTAGKTTLTAKFCPPLGAAPEVKFPEMFSARNLKNGLNVVLLERHSRRLSTSRSRLMPVRFFGHAGESGRGDARARFDGRRHENARRFSNRKPA